MPQEGVSIDMLQRAQVTTVKNDTKDSFYEELQCVFG
jgi:hypothetical protein